MLPSDEAEWVNEWLRSHRFKRLRASGGHGTSVWARDRCQVKVRKADSGACAVEIRPDDDCDWMPIDDILSQHGMDATRLVRAPLEAALSHVVEGSIHKPPSPGSRLYERLGPAAYLCKVALQMLIGAGSIGGLVLALIHVLSAYHGQATWEAAAHVSILVITAALASAGAVELAYTLYTPGPDEVLDPLMLGLSAGILLLITRSDLPVGLQFLGVISGVLSLGGLFLIRQNFINRKGL